MKRYIALLFCIVVLTGMAAGCAKKNNTSKGNGTLLNFTQPKTGDQTATIETSMGNIKVMFFKQIAPKAVENFLTHAQKGYYNNVIFHRVIENFMIQSGDPNGTGMGGQSIWGKGFANETSNEARNFRGALAMAHSKAPNSNGSQFYIVSADRNCLIKR